MIKQIHPNTKKFDVLDNVVKVDFENFQNQIKPKEKQSIEKLTVPNPGGQKNQKNVAITINTKLIQNSLLKVYSKVCISEITTPRCLEKLAKRKPDLVFSGVKYFEFDGAHIWLNDFLEPHNICYIGSNHTALNCEHEKGLAKSIVKEAGVVTADYVVMKANSFPTRKTANMAYPVFVKPVIGGDSIGIDDLPLVFNPEQLGAKIKQIFNVLNCDVFVESYLAGREFSVGILEDEKSGVLTAMPIEIIAPKNNRSHRVLDFDIKRLD